MFANSFLTVAHGDFNTVSQTWCKNGKALKEESKYDISTCSYGLLQLIDEPIHLEWEKGNVVPMRETYHKQCTKNYELVPLFPINSKTFKRLLLNELYKFFVENDLLSSNQ